jgi:hypothetical protein
MRWTSVTATRRCRRQENAFWNATRCNLPHECPPHEVLECAARQLARHDLKGQKGPETKAFDPSAGRRWRIGTGNFCGQNREFLKTNRELSGINQRSG